jgi:PAS domain S-box-containing protein
MSDHPRNPIRLWEPKWGWAAIYALSYAALLGLSEALSRGTPALPPWNPAPALLVVPFLLEGKRFLPAALIAGLTATFLGFFLHSSRLILGWQAAEIAIYGGAAWLLRGSVPVDPDLSSFEAVFRFLAVASCSALIMTGLYLLSLGKGSPAAAGWMIAGQRFWLADMIGILVGGPFLLLHRGLLRKRRALVKLLRWEVLAQIIAIAGVLWLIFPRTVGSRFYPMFIPLIWIAARGGLAGVVAALLGIEACFITAIALLDLPANQVVKLQILMLTLSVTGLLLGAVISERERARALVAAGEARLKAIIDMAPDGMLIADMAGRVTMVNRQFEILSGRGAVELCGRPLAQLLPQAELQTTAQSLLQADEGRSIPVEISTSELTIGSERAVVAAVRDITRRRQAEADLDRRRSAMEHASRSSLTGELAAALAHELNQPLVAIVNFTEASRRFLADPLDPSRIPLALELIAKATAQAERAGQVIRRLRAFFVNSVPETEPTSVIDMVQEVLLLMAEETARRGATIELTIADDLRVHVDKLQIQQVLVNLLRNSLDALFEVPTPMVRIAADRHIPGMIRVALRDNGPGFDREISARLFTPFTTTRSFGMGLGLSISRSIIEAHGGRLWVGEMPAEGALLYFTLPIEQTMVASTP